MYTLIDKMFNVKKVGNKDCWSIYNEDGSEFQSLLLKIVRYQPLEAVLENGTLYNSSLSDSEGGSHTASIGGSPGDSRAGKRGAVASSNALTGSPPVDHLKHVCLFLTRPCHT